MPCKARNATRAFLVFLLPPFPFSYIASQHAQDKLVVLLFFSFFFSSFHSFPLDQTGPKWIYHRTDFSLEKKKTWVSELGGSPSNMQLESRTEGALLKIIYEVFNNHEEITNRDLNQQTTLVAMSLHREQPKNMVQA